MNNEKEVGDMQEDTMMPTGPRRRRRQAAEPSDVSPTQEKKEEVLHVPTSVPAVSAVRDALQTAAAEHVKTDKPGKKEVEKTSIPENRDRNRSSEKAESTESRHNAAGTRGYVPDKLTPEQLASAAVRREKTQTGSMTHTGSAGHVHQSDGMVRTGSTGRVNQQTGGVGQSGGMPRMGYSGSQRIQNGPSQPSGAYRTGYPSGSMPVMPHQGGTTAWTGNTPRSQSGSQSVVRTNGSGGYPPRSQTAPNPMAQSQGLMQTRGVTHSGSQQVPPAPAKGNMPVQGKSSGEKAGKGQRLIRLIVVGVVLAAITFGAVRVIGNIQTARAVRERVEAYNAYFVPGVFVDGISLGGMTYDEALSIVRSNAQSRSDAWSVALTYQGSLVQRINASDLNITVDVQETMNEAWQQGHQGTIEERSAAMDALEITPYEAFTANPGGDQSKINDILQNLANLVYRAPEDATIETFNPDLTYPFVFHEEVAGRRLDTDSLRKAIFQSLSSMESDSIELTIESIAPKVTVDWIKENLVAERGFGSTPITSHSTDNRNENIRVAFSKISGTVLQPGESFSFNDIVGQRTEKNGFLPAIEYAYGEVSDGIGGGVCQASTTVYLAAVRAGMQIVKREPHSDAVNYISYGKDATVYWYSNHKIDMVFKNPTDQPVYITAAVQSDRNQRTKLVCNVRIYGAGMDGITYDIVTEETVIEAPMEPEYVKDKNGDYVTYTDEEKVVRQASNGCQVTSWRVAYKDGEEIERKYMYTDTYKPKPERIYVGVTPR